MEIFQPFVYGLYDPAEVGHIRYVGMAPSKPSRPYEHAKRARKDVTDCSYLMNWIRSIQREGREPSVMILEQLGAGTDRHFCGFVESCYIKSLRSIGHRLTNENDGGWGGSCPSYKHTEESKAKMHAAWEAKKGQPRPPVSAETRVKLSEGNKRRVTTDSARVNMSKARKGCKKSDVTRARMRLAQAGRIITPEARVKISATLTGRKATDETRAKMVLSRAAYLERKSKDVSAEESTT